MSTFPPDEGHYPLLPIPHGVLLLLALTLATIVVEAPRSRAADPAVDGAWTLIPASLPPPRTGAMVTYDSRRHRLVLFGGNGSSISYAETWVLDMADPQAWQLLPVKGEDPLGRGLGVAVYDSLYDRLMISGGRNHTGAVYAYTAQLWFTDTPGDSATWDFFTPGIAPGGDRPQARYAHTAIYDPIRQEMVMYGGTNPAGANIVSIWALTLDAVPTWHLRTPCGFGGGSAYAQSGYDPHRRRMVIYGGYAIGPQWTLWIDLAAAWSLDSSGWTTLTPGDAGCFAVATVDPARDRLLRYRGRDPNGWYCDPDSVFLTLDFESGTADTLWPAPPHPVNPWRLVFDPRESSIWVIEDGSLRTWTITWPTVSGVDPWSETDGLAAAMGLPRPNPATDRVSLPFWIGSSTWVDLAIVDLQGRLVRRLWQGSLGPGRFDLPWNLSDEAGRRVAPGIYFARMVLGTIRESRRIVIVGE